MNLQVVILSIYGYEEVSYLNSIVHCRSTESCVPEIVYVLARRFDVNFNLNSVHFSTMIACFESELYE